MNGGDTARQCVSVRQRQALCEGALVYTCRVFRSIVLFCQWDNPRVFAILFYTSIFIHKKGGPKGGQGRAVNS